MKKGQTYGEGSVYYNDSKGRWVGTYSLGKGPDGKRKRKTVYGRTKLEGERILLETSPDSIVIRTAWLYSPFGKNFVKTMLKLDLINMEKTNPDLLKDIQAGINKTEEPFKGILASINRSQGSSSDIAFREEVGFQLFGGKSSGLSMYEKSVVDLQNNLEKYEKDHPEKFTDPNSLESRVKDFLNGIPDPDLDKLPKDALPEDMQHLYPEVPKEQA